MSQATNSAGCSSRDPSSPATTAAEHAAVVTTDASGQLLRMAPRRPVAIVSSPIERAECALEDVNEAIEQVLDGSASAPRLGFRLSGATTPALAGSAPATVTA